MEIARAERPDAGEIAAFFEAVLAATESVGEGRLVGQLARDLIPSVPEAEIAVLTCREGAELAGCIMLTRLAFAEDAGVVVLLAPVGVATVRQGRESGRRCCATGLEAMRAAGRWRRPGPLRRPHGWLGRNLRGEVGGVVKGPSRCVAAPDRAEYW